MGNWLKAMMGNLGGGRTAARRATSAKGGIAQNAPSRLPDPSRAPPVRSEQQFDRLTGVVTSAAQHGQRAQVLHDRAGLRIDAALYELEQLRLELEAVVAPHPIAADGAGTVAGVGAAAGETANAASARAEAPVRVAPAGPRRSAA